MRFNTTTDESAQTMLQEHSNGVCVHELSRCPARSQQPVTTKKKRPSTTAATSGSSARANQKNTRVWCRCVSMKSATGRSIYAMQTTTAAAQSTNPMSQYRNRFLVLITGPRACVKFSGTTFQQGLRGPHHQDIDAAGNVQ